MADNNFEIYHRTNSVAERRHKFKPQQDTDKCGLCHLERNIDVIEDHEHLLLFCPVTEDFWRNTVFPLLGTFIANLMPTLSIRVIGFAESTLTKEQKILGNFVLMYARYVIWFVSFDTYRNGARRLDHDTVFREMMRDRRKTLRYSLSNQEFKAFIPLAL